VTKLNTQLLEASRDGHTQTVELLLEKGANVNVKNKYGYTALMYASMYGHTETAELLLEKGGYSSD